MKNLALMAGLNTI